MPNQKNISQIKKIKQSLKKSQSVVLTDYKGLNVKQLTDLRQEIKQAGGEFKVCKNTLLKIGLKQTNYPIKKDLNNLTGPSAILFCYQDEIAPIKALYDFYQKNNLPKIKFGFLAKKTISQEKVISLAKLPALEVLQAKLISCLNSPIYSLTYVLKANLQGLINALKEISKKTN